MNAPTNGTKPTIAIKPAPNGITIPTPKPAQPPMIAPIKPKIIISTVVKLKLPMKNVAIESLFLPILITFNLKYLTQNNYINFTAYYH